MNQNAQDKAKATLIVILAVVVVLVLIGMWTEGFGLFRDELSPGSTTPPNDPS